MPIFPNSPINRVKTKLLSGKNIIRALLPVLMQQALLAQSDTSYVRTFERELALQAYVSNKYTSLSYQLSSDEDEYTYMPNSIVKPGIGFMWKSFALYLGYGFEVLNNEDKGKTKSLDLQLHYYGRRFLIDFFGQNYHGFYMDDGEECGSYLLRPDLKVFQYGLLVQYVINNKKFSYTAAFNQDEWQKRSSGSLHFGMGVYYNQTMADSSYLPGNIVPDHQRFRSILVGPSIGYAYTFVIGSSQHFFITPSLSVGLHLGITGTNIREDKKFGVYPSIFPRVAAGYNAERWALCLSYATNKVVTASEEDTMLSLDTGYFLLIFSKRFNFHPKIPKFLKPIL